MTLVATNIFKRVTPVSVTTYQCDNSEKSMRMSVVVLRIKRKSYDKCSELNESRVTNLMKTSIGSFAPRRGVMHKATASQLKNITRGTKLPNNMLIRIRPMSPPNCAQTTVIPGESSKMENMA